MTTPVICNASDPCFYFEPSVLFGSGLISGTSQIMDWQAPVPGGTAISLLPALISGGLPSAPVAPPGTGTFVNSARSNEISRQITDGSVTISSNLLNSTAQSNFAQNDIGAIVKGTGIPSGTTITAINSATQVVMSNTATASGSGLTITIVSAKCWGFVAGNNPPNAVYVNNGGTYSSGFLVNTPQIYFVEYGGKLVQGQNGRVFGKNLCAGNGTFTPQIFLVNTGNTNYIYALTWGNAYDYQGQLAYQLQYELRFNVPRVTVSNVSLTTNVATITTSAAHNFISGVSVVISGLTNTEFNGTWTITSVPTTTTFTFALTHADVPSASDSGTVDIPTGTYNLWIYNGQGGNYGFGLPSSVILSAPPSITLAKVDPTAAPYNADPTGATDSTTAILNAMNSLARSVTDASLTSGSNLINSATANFTSNDVGAGLIGTGIPAGTVINSINSSSQAVMSNNATANETNDSVTISHGTMTFPVGQFLISQTIPLPPGVNIQGQSAYKTSLVAASSFAAAPSSNTTYGSQSVTAMVYASTNSQISNISMEGSATTPGCVLVVTNGQPANNVTITNCILQNPYAPLVTSGGPAGGCVLVYESNYVEVSYCELYGLVGVYPNFGPWTYCRTIGNHFHGDPITSAMFSTSQHGAMFGQYCIIEDNLCEYANRGFTCGPFFGQVSQNWIARNLVKNGGNVYGAGESFLFEFPEVGNENWLGHPSAVTANTLAQTDQTWTVNQLVGRQVVVVDGSGFGQYRTVQSNTTTTVTLTQNWTIQPDTNSTVVIRQFPWQLLLVNNSSRITRGGLELQGAVDCIVDGHGLFHSQNGIWLFGNYTPNTPSRLCFTVCAFNTIRNCTIVHSGSNQLSGGIVSTLTGINIGSSRYLANLTPVPLVFGNRCIANNFSACGIQATNSFYSGGWLLPSDSRLVTAPCSTQFNAFSQPNTSFLVGSNSRIQTINNWTNLISPTDIFLDAWSIQNYVFLPGIYGAVPQPCINGNIAGNIFVQ